MQRIPPELSLTLIEYISHLMVQDWDSIADDLVRLGFVDDMSDRDSLVRVWEDGGRCRCGVGGSEEESEGGERDGDGAVSLLPVSLSGVPP